jgi:hypothetical protein
MSQSREQVKAQMPKRWKTLAEKSAKRVDALLHAITLAQLSADLDKAALRNVLIAELESAMYHAARAHGDPHKIALDKSRQGRKQADALAGWA